MADITAAPEKSYDADEFGQYRSLSTLSVMALVFGLLSPIAFFTSLLIVVPLVATGVALWALARIQRSEGSLQGTRLAYCGLALAIVFGVSSVARTQFRAELLRRQANVTVELWLSMLAEGKAEEAMALMTLKAVSNLGVPDTGDASVPIFEDELRTAQILQDPLAVALIARLQTGQESALSSVDHLVFDMAKPRVLFYYRLPNAPTQDSLFAVSLIKTQENFGPITWLVEGWSSEDLTLP